MDWCHVDSRGAGGILLMWDHRAVSRIDTCMGRFVGACLLGMWMMVWCGPLQVCMARIEIISDGGCGTN